MRMATHHFVGYRPGHFGKPEQAGFLGHPRMIDDLKQQVAEFVRQRGQIAPRDGVGDLIGFLDRIGRDGAEALLLVPWAAMVGVAKRRHDREQTTELVLGGQGQTP